MSTEGESYAVADFDPKLMNEALDLSDPEYGALLEKHRHEEEDRANRKAEELRTRSIFRRIVDNLVPA